MPAPFVVGPISPELRDTGGQILNRLKVQPCVCDINVAWNQRGARVFYSVFIMHVLIYCCKLGCRPVLHRVYLGHTAVVLTVRRCFLYLYLMRFVVRLNEPLNQNHGHPTIGAETPLVTPG